MASRLTEPGTGQRRISGVFSSALVGGSILISVAAVVHAVVKANLQHLVDPIARLRIWQWNFVDTNNSVLILVGLLTLLALRRQITAGLMPKFSYEGGYTNESEFRGASPELGDFRQIRIVNAGPGMLLMSGTDYRVSFESDADRPRQELPWIDYERLLELMEAQGFEWGTHYFLSHVSPGYGMTSGHQRLIVELSRTVYARLRVLDIRYRFRSAMGDTFQSIVYVISRVPAERRRPKILVAR